MDNPETFEGTKGYEFSLKCHLTEDNIKTKQRYERERLEALEAKIEAYRGVKPIGNLLHFSLNITDCDFGYSGYVNE
jgi:hypothetical protein